MTSLIDSPFLSLPFSLSLSYPLSNSFFLFFQLPQPFHMMVLPKLQQLVRAPPSFDLYNLVKVIDRFTNLADRPHTFLCACFLFILLISFNE